MTYSDPDKKRIYKTWWSMKRRCQSDYERSKYWAWRGIKVCDEWINDFNVFYDWALKNGYRADLTLDRINNDCDYSPSNCRWASLKAQARNRRSNKLVDTPYGCITIPELAEKVGIKTKTMYERRRCNPDIDYEELVSAVRRRA